MLPKRSRLSKQVITDHLIRAQRARTAHFLVMYARAPEASQGGISASVSKKVAPKATDRNRVRRRTYAALQPLLPSLSPKMAVLVTCLSKETFPLEDMTRELEGIFKKEGITV